MAVSRDRYAAEPWNVAGLAVTDPGDTGAIPITYGRSYCAITTAGSETRTLASPDIVGQEILIWIDTDGGTCVITTATPVNLTGNNTITMAEAQDYIRLIAITAGGALRWAVGDNAGAALSTV